MRTRKRDGRRSSLPPPPPGEAGTEAVQRHEAGEHDDVERDERVSVSVPSLDAADVSDRDRETDSEVIVVASTEIVAVEVVTLPKSASALLSAAIPSSSRTKAARPVEPSSGATPVATPVAAAGAPAAPEPLEPREPRASDPADDPEPTPIIDMPSLVEAANAETTNPDVTALGAADLDAATAASPADEKETADAAKPTETAEAAEPNEAKEAAPDVAADPGVRGQPSIPDATEVSFFDPAAVDAHIARAHEPSDAHDIHSLSQAELLHRRRALPEVAARRARLARYVKVTIGTAAAILVLAVLLHLSARSGRAGGQTTEMLMAPPSGQGASTPSDPVKTTGATVAATKPAAAAFAVASMDAAANAPAPVASSTASATATTTPTPGVAGETSARPTELAADADAAAPLKAFAQRALEKGKLADAIDAGEQATALDSTDAKSWLVLGGAYQDRGDMVNARRCYRACAEHATRGPVNECRALGGR